MCGIAGIFSPDAELLREQIDAMTSSLAHRGPDNQGICLNRNSALGHRRLSILDLSPEANQPMVSADGRYTIVYNGELYNYREIAAGLSLNLHTHGDTEVVLEAFAQKGPEVVSRFNGMFSFAIHDSKEERLWLFRDRIGKKPLFYCRQENRLMFASELKALVPFLQDRTLDMSSVAAFMHLGFIPGDQTIYSSVKKLPMGSGLSADEKNISVFRWWKPEPAEAIEYGSETEAADRLKDLLTDSVRLRLVSDVPYGCFLSGGIDSSVVTAVAHELLGKKLKTFTIGFSDAASDEAPFAAKIAARLGTEHYEHYVSEKDAIAFLPEVIDHFDEPFADTSALPTWILSKHTRQHVKMALSGDGGDELFFGYGTTSWARRTQVPQILRPFLRNLLLFGNQRLQRAAGHFSDPAGNASNALVLSQELYFFTPEEIRKLVKPEFALIPPEIAVSGISAAARQSLFDLTCYLPDDLLVKVDRCSMKEGLEVRCPLLDHRIISFALGLPDNLKERNGIKKYLLKKVLFAYIPEKFFERPKHGFSVPLAKWLQKDLRFLIEIHLNEQAVEEAGILNYKVVREYIHKFMSGKTFLYNRVWNLIVLQRWLSANRYE